MNKKKLILVLTIVALLFAMSGCTMPTDEAGNIILITEDTTFDMIINSEGLFSAIFVFPLAKLIAWLTPMTNVGVALIIVTLLVNALALLLTFNANVDMQKMQMIQPELQRIQKKYEGKDDQNSKMRAATEMQNVYKKYDIHPLKSMLAQFIQYPILIAVYYAVRRSSAIATATFLGLNLETSPLAGVQQGEWAYALLFILMILAQFLSIKAPQLLQERRMKKEAEIHHRRYEKPENPAGGMMYFMIIFIGILMISWPSAMSLYYLISSLVMILKAVIMNKIADKKSAEKK